VDNLETMAVVAQNATTELVTRLRKGADYEWDTFVMQEAADTITRLTAEVERLRALLERVGQSSGFQYMLWELREDISAALQEPRT